MRSLSAPTKGVKTTTTEPDATAQEKAAPGGRCIVLMA